MTELETKDKKEPIDILITMAVIIFIVWALSGAFVVLAFKKPDGPGTFGDMFGAINSLFSGLAFSGIIYTIMIQRNELSLQREELALQREEIRKSTEELAGQKEQMVIQRFETTFFNLLSMQNELTNSIEISHMIRGRKVFKEIHEEFYNRFNHPMYKSSDKLAELSYISTLDHYYRHVTTLVTFVHNDNTLLDNSKEMYIGFFASQCTSYEIIFIFYYSLINRNFYELLLEYKFFVSLDEALLFGNIGDKELRAVKQS
ncbi:putative phage abortive infection protein [Paenibacillus sp. NRS-1760]|uniref:putative phage abortive infection protein n=1 Tax=Paenibacillus sp. NRS-1760 TaxID=3233902 RepID=UPI003D2C7B05